jgi:hypothetical protein
MDSEGSEWSDRLFVIGLILVLIGIALLCIVGLIFVVSVYYNTHSDTLRNTVFVGIIMIVIGAGVVVAIDRLGH